jgi:hypothetical protein
MAGMNRILSLVVSAGFLFIAPALERMNAQDVSPSRFVGEWVGVQKWAGDTAPVNARTPQPVEIKIELVDGRLVGSIMPFMGGSDGAGFVDGTVAGDELKASGSVGPPRLTDGNPRQARGLAGWKSAVKVNFSFVAKGNNNQLSGTVDVVMDSTPWIKYEYDLSRKRSRY